MSILLLLKNGSMIWPHLALVLFYALHSLLADTSVKLKLYAFLPQRWYRLGYNVFSVVSLGACLYLYWQTTKSFIFFQSLWLIMIGISLLVAGISLLVLALKGYDTGAFIGISVEKEGETLKTDGWNGIVRHPIYLAVFLIIWGLFLAVPMDIFLGMALITTGYIYVGIWLEERKLKRQFGVLYEEYQRKVPMLLPAIKCLRLKLFTRK
jgi:protein-S-isoprenylcysteine O-methyltransferase Ste14